MDERTHLPRLCERIAVAEVAEGDERLVALYAHGTHRSESGGRTEVKTRIDNVP